MAAAKINSGQKDEFGGKRVNAFYTDDQAWCLTEAIGVTLGAAVRKQPEHYWPR